MRFPWQGGDALGSHSSQWLRRRITGALLLVSALPFLLLGAGAWFVFRSLAIEQSLGLHRTAARAHAAAIDLYLSEKLHTLEIIARTNSLEELRNPDRLRSVFEAVEGVHQSSFVDLGVIDGAGRHLAYVGPYDLQNRLYQDADWFHAVMAQGSIVSDVFMGFRQVPHSVIAVRQASPQGWWVLRATLDNRSLYALVRSVEVGAQGDVFIVNRQGLYQTPPREGDVLTPSSPDRSPASPRRGGPQGPNAGGRDATVRHVAERRPLAAGRATARGEILAPSTGPWPKAG